jgi:hypothetical protein
MFVENILKITSNLNHKRLKDKQKIFTHFKISKEKYHLNVPY